MKLRSLVGSGATILLVGLVVAMLLGQQLGQPIVLGFVVTGSMSPTLEPGDGFVAVPPSIAGDIEENDVVTFDAQELEGGGLTTHRVVGETDQGYVTQGDANPFTDQDGPEPPVQESQIAAVALQFDGEVVVIPQIGTVAMALQGALGSVAGVLSSVPGLDGLADGDIGSLMMGAGLLLLGYSIFSDFFLSGGRERGDRERSKGGKTSAVVILLVILLLITVPATASMAIPSGTNDITIVSSQSPSENPTVIERGESAEFEYEFANDGFIPRIAIIEPASTGVEVDERLMVVSRGESAETTARVHAPDETGAYLRSISERQYIQLLPVPLIVALHDIHPFVAIAAINGVIVVAVTAVFVVSVGLQPFRFRSKERDVSSVDKIRRTVRKWF